MDKYGLRKKIIAYVKDERSNLNVMTTTLKVIVNYESFGLKESFKGIYFGHVFSKPCQYGITKEKVCKDLKYVSINFAQIDLQKCIIWPKKFGKGRKVWNKVSVEMAFTQKIEHSNENHLDLFVSLLFQQFIIFEVLNYITQLIFCIIGYVVGLLVSSLCSRGLINLFYHYALL